MQSLDDEGSHMDDSMHSATNFGRTIPDNGSYPHRTSNSRKDELLYFATAPALLAEESGAATLDEPARAAGERPNLHILQDLLQPDQVTFRSSEEQFTALFDQGCREYAGKNLDGAYIMWNKALSIASDKKNREWMAVVTSNLQRLSYEILVKEGRDLMGKGELEEAGRAFELAQDVAQKAHNALWVSEMQEARKELLSAVFHRCHAAASAIFERARQVQAQPVTTDDYYIVPGTDVMVSHTETFVTQWTRLLLVQEAIGMWSDAAQVAHRLGGTAGAALHTIIRNTLDTVSCFLATVLFDAAEPKGISFQHTEQYHYHESIMLVELWRDIIGHLELHMRHDILHTIAVLQLGNLYLASNQLADAIVQFEKVIELGQATDNRLLETTGLTMSALLNWQRANYAVAEQQIATSLTMWGALQRRQRETSVDAYKGEGRGGADSYAMSQAEARHGIHGTPSKDMQVRLLQAAPAGYVHLMLNVCYHYRMCLLVNTYRYREALEAFEEALNYQYHDLLHEKICLNYPGRMTVDQIEATARQMGSPLVYYGLAYRYDWSLERQAYDVTESVFIWVVPKNNAVRFVEMNVTREFKTTVGQLIDKVRVGLCLNPVGSDAPADTINSILPRKSWVDSLQLLHLLLVDPVVGYLHGAQEGALGRDDVVTIIPSRAMWVVPYNALMSPRGDNRYVVEEMALQLAFSAAQCALCSLGAQRVRERGLQRRTVVCHQEVDSSISVHLRLLHPLDVHRSLSEGREVHRALAQTTETLMRETVSESSERALFTGANTLVDDLDAVRSLLSQSRYIHFAVATTSSGDRPNVHPDENVGALCLPASHTHSLGMLWADEVAHAELFAELVTLSNTNMSPERVGGPDDDVLGLLRSFFSSGVPCIVAGQWCTPDMVPAELFAPLYGQLPCAVDRRDADHPLSGPVSSATGTRGQPARVEATPHKAVLLAKVMRDLINGDDTMRFAPRCWAGYCCIGCGAY
ncbi:TPR repeat-containing protein [Strigomonas culicis]|uniref:TPR repeat-containing protein n=1 Tax=Strigomonas culicis TaxID=28005 RepID=S9UJ87_9TRYP|nr:TPR repeat-containing protein [Strigomonas culicis]|eukprot:EPY28988.1 TPR repeat-containing protein [Strigomonas culicis]